MTQRNDSGFKSFKAGEALEPYRRVKLSAAKTVSYADGSGDLAIGVTIDRAAINDQVTVKLFTGEGTFEIEAAGAITAAAAVYGAADGKITATSSGNTKLGTANSAASGAAEIVEVCKDF